MVCPAVSSFLMNIPFHLCFVWPRQFHHKLEFTVSTSLSHVCLSCWFTSFSYTWIWGVSSAKTLTYSLQQLLEETLPLGCTFKYKPFNQQLYNKFICLQWQHVRIFRDCTVRHLIQSWLGVFPKLITGKRRIKNSTKFSSWQSSAPIEVNKVENTRQTKKLVGGIERDKMIPKGWQPRKATSCTPNCKQPS